jgi:ABC-type sugar transport system substrate-binding protein
MKRTVALCLLDKANGHQQLIEKDAKTAAKRAGLDLETYFADGHVTAQVKQIYGCIHGEAAARTCAIVIMPARDNGLNRVALDAVRAGLAWICLHRQMDCLSDLRREFPEIPISTVTPDQLEIGRIQGRQFRALLPSGGRVLYVQGNAQSSPARVRLQGMREAIAGSNIEAADVIDGNWIPADAEHMVSGWLRMVMSGKSQLDLVGCQNDLMATGARKALETVGAYLNRPDLATIRLTGCDGLPEFGQKLVNEGKLAATVIVPSSGTPALELVAAAIDLRRLPPASVILSSASYPSETVLAGGSRKTN